MGGRAVAPEHSAEQLGRRLRTARQRAGWTVEEAGVATAIPPVYLDALEEGRLDLLPGPVYTRGYVRTYATALHLDGDSFTYAFCRLDPEGRFDDLVPAERGPRRQFSFAPRRWAKVALIGVCILVGLVALDALWAAVGPDDSGSRAVDRSPTQTTGPRSATQAPPLAAPVPQPGPAPALAPTSQDAEGAVFAVGRPSFVVTIDPKGRSWLQVREGPEGDVRFEGTVEAGQTQSLPAPDGLLFVRVGDQSAVGVRVDDTPLVLPATPGEPYNVDVRTSPPEADAG